MKNDGGPAFPATDWNPATETREVIGGMSLRDYFAAHAPKPVETMLLEDHCAWRYKYADAMLKARGAG